MALRAPHRQSQPDAAQRIGAVDRFFCTIFFRVGAAFGAERLGVMPDMIKLAKGLTNGVIPTGAVLVRDEIYEAFMHGPHQLIELFHGYTYSGHPVAAAAGVARLDVKDERGRMGLGSFKALGAAHVIAREAEAFCEGLAAIAALSEGHTYLCHAAGADIPGMDTRGIVAAAFSGPHPAGLAGTHIHFLSPVSARRTVWTVGYQDVIAIGRLCRDGVLDFTRVVALGGPGFERPVLLAARAAASEPVSTPGRSSFSARTTQSR